MVVACKLNKTLKYFEVSKAVSSFLKVRKINVEEEREISTPAKKKHFFRKIHSYYNKVRYIITTGTGNEQLIMTLYNTLTIF